MSNGTIDLRGNTNFVVLKNLLHQEVVPRTNLAAVDLTVANGLAITGNTLYTNLATSEDLTNATLGHLVDASVLGPILDSKQATLTAGDLIDITGGTINRKRYMDIISDSNIATRSITPTGATAAVNAFVLEPGNAYKVHVASTAKWFATTADFKSSSETWGIEGHIELFVAGTGYVHTDDNVVLATALEPDAVNNCTVRFHDGKAIISVEDTIAGYVVTVAGGTEGTSTGGSLYYGLASNVGEYISVDGSLSGTVLDLSGVTTYNAEKHVVGNGYSNTVVSGAISCANKTTFSNLGMNGVVVAGGTMTLGDVYIPQGATVSVSGGGLAVEKVSGNGGVIALNQTNIASASNIQISGVVISGGSSDRGGAFRTKGGSVKDCTFLNCSAYNFGGAILVDEGVMTISNCIFSGCDCPVGAAVMVQSTTTLPAYVTGCTATGNNGAFGTFAVLGPIHISSSIISGNSVPDIRNTGSSGLTYLDGGNTIGIVSIANGTMSIAGSNKIEHIKQDQYGSGDVVISSGAVLDLTGNTNATPINPGGGVVFEAGGATVLYGEVGSASSMFIDGLSMPDGVIESGGVVNVRKTTGVDFYPPIGSRSFAVTGGTINCGSTGSGTIECYWANNEIIFQNVKTTANHYIAAGSPSNIGGSIVFGGTISLVGASARVASFANNESALGSCTLLDNTVLDVTSSTRTATQGIVGGIDGTTPYPVGTVIIGSNATIKDGDTIVPLTGGTYHRCYILKNGTITEA